MDNNDFGYRYEEFWCGINQTPEEKKFQTELMSLFKKNKILYEIPYHDIIQINSKTIEHMLLLYT